jgi:DNA replication protein DnaC
MKQAVLESNLKELKLPMFMQYYTEYGKIAASQNQPYEQYLKALTDEEISNRDNNRVKKLTTNARFPFRKTLTEYQFEEVPGIKKQEIIKYAECKYIDLRENICLLGQTGTGKTHLAIALGLEACKRKYSVLFLTAAKLVNQLIEARSQLHLSTLQKKFRRANLVIVDELGYLPLSKEGSEYLFQFFADRYEQGSTIITSNLEFADWAKFMGDSTMTSALLDRVTHHCHIVAINGESYRFKQRKKKGVIDT